MDNEQGAGKASLEDLKRGALAHYEEAAAAAHHWSSFIPKAIEAYQEWISISDKVPGHKNEVLIGGECCELCYNIDIGFLEDGEWFLKNGESPHYKVTHWMPLPNPPQSVNS